MTFSETLFKRLKSRDQRPYVEFQVHCRDVTKVSWVLMAAPKDSIELHNVSYDGSDDRTFTTGLCSLHYGLDAVDDNITLDGQHCDFDEQLTDVQSGDVYDYCCDNTSGIVLNYKYMTRYIAGGRFTCDPDNYGMKKIKALPYDGHYTLFIESEPDDFGEDTAQQPGPVIWGYIKYMNREGMLSAMVYPLLVFYGVMGLVYLLMGIVWVVAMAINYQDLLRLQFWLCAVIGVGMIEFAFAYGDLDYLNAHGHRSHFLFVTAQVLHALKSTTARVLVLVVSMGYGVVKPRLGAAYKQIVVGGVIYFILDAVYGVYHNKDQSMRESKTAMMVAVPLSVLDAFVLWWIFFALHSTMKILALRQNKIKLLLYHRFRMLLAFFAIGSIVFFGWTLYNNWDTATNHSWENFWVQEAFLHILFTIVLVGILVLWRPTMNNSRYAYAALETDLLDDEEEEEYHVVPHFGSETMKARTLSSRGLRAASPRDDVEDALQWVEENIPMAVMSNDNTMSSYPMDSDEEVLNTRFELSKME
eukprot:CAMPEP_0206312618 /NCGR_PEP_ID=MMETSP0106_2-20121207/14086_1 /ASSEMBLY_ACC=CAM_ASM_000206 /TAXON_ID=81532 /ORGANISM="Acanthoeca-like sp., Strain 10tr" /LENGTH=527 /DNA_ID=CAMNT_0053743931 /DNA_START=20 /DNA_END=1603 /DNA_ORIENTATION=-